MANKESKEELTGDDDRIFELMVGLEKFKKTEILNKIIGSGWYSSRETINNVRNEVIENYQNRLNEFNGITPSQSPASLQGIVSLLLDTGIFGVIFFGFLYLLVIKKIIINIKDSFLRLFLISMLGMNAFCLLIGYPYSNVIYWLVFLPGGIFQFKQNSIEA